MPFLTLSDQTMNSIPFFFFFDIKNSIPLIMPFNLTKEQSMISMININQNFQLTAGTSEAIKSLSLFTTKYVSLLRV